MVTDSLLPRYASIPSKRELMTEVSFIQNAERKLTGFTCSGHAFYARKNKDVVCAGISVLTINTINSLENIAGADIDVKQDDGYLSVVIRSEPDVRTETLMRSAYLGLSGISAEYGSKFCRVTIKEEILC